jgi:hypothetical protein
MYAPTLLPHLGRIRYVMLSKLEENCGELTPDEE